MSLSLGGSRRFLSLLAALAAPLVLAACPALDGRDTVPREDLVHACRGYDAALGQLAQVAATVTMHPAVQGAADSACDRVRQTGRQ